MGGQPGVYRKFQDSQGYTVRHCFSETEESGRGGERDKERKREGREGGERVQLQFLLLSPVM